MHVSALLEIIVVDWHYTYNFHNIFYGTDIFTKFFIAYFKLIHETFRRHTNANMDDGTTTLPTFDMTQDVNNDLDCEENLFVPR